MDVTEDAKPGEPTQEWGMMVSEHGRWWVPPPPDWKPPEPDLPDDPRTELPGLWEFAKLVWREIIGLWDDPVTMLRQEYMSRLAYRRCTDWVRNLETLVRRIIIIAALTMKLAPLKQPAPGEAPRPWGLPRFQRTLWHDNTTWKVCFTMFPAKRVAPPGARRLARERRPRREHSLPTAGLARRIEALRRVIRYRETYALRFARFMARVKAKNRTTNGDPREFHLPKWDFHWDRRTSGKYAVDEGMHPAHPLAARSLALWHEPG